MKSLVVLLPTLDEEYGLREILPLIPRQQLTTLGWNTEVWVVDGGSRDPRDGFVAYFCVSL